MGYSSILYSWKFSHGEKYFRLLHPLLSWAKLLSHEFFVPAKFISLNISFLQYAKVASGSWAG